MSPPAPEAQASISAVGRIFGVLFSPKATFEDIVRKPSWLVPVIILGLMGVAVATGINQKINWREFMSQQIEKSPRGSQLSEEQKEKQIEAGAKVAPITTYAFGVPAPILLVLIVALVMWGAYNIMAGVNPGYKTALGIVSHAYVPVIIANILFLIVLFLKPEGTLDLENPMATNVAALLPEGTPKWLDALGKNIDVFLIWVVILIAIGFAAANPKKLKGGKSFGIAFGVFALYVVLRVGFAFVLS
jgi:hypothetical protein